MNLTLLRYALGLGGLLAALGGMYMIGHTDGTEKAERAAKAALAAHLQRTIDQAAEVARQDAEILSHSEVRAAATETRFRTINREVIRYVDTHDPVDCLQPDGVRVWNDANAGADAPVAAEPGATVPAPAVNRYRAIRERFAQSRRDGAVVSPMPGPTSSPGELVNPEGVTP